MEVERRSRLKIVNPDRGTVGDSLTQALPVQSSRTVWKQWNDDLWREIGRIHALIDKVNAEMGEMNSDESLHAIRVLEKSTELRELQAYYKGLRFALDRQKQISGRSLIVSFKLD